MHDGRASLGDVNDLSEVLIEFARTLLTDFPIQGILDRLVGRMVDVLPITSAGVTLLSDESAPRYIAASDGNALRFEQLQTDLNEGPCVAAFFSGQPVAVTDLRMERRFPRFCPPAIARGLAAVFTFPLRHGDQQLGALDLYRDTTGALSDADMEIAQTLADVAAAYILNAQIRTELQSLSAQSIDTSLHDPLTGLANRALLLKTLSGAALRVRESGHLLAVFFIDLDDLKSTNDVYGHQAGDELLVAVAGRLASLVRAGDTLARLSGDEFVLVFDNLKRIEEVEAVAARVLRALSGRFRLSQCEVQSTSSIGIATTEGVGMLAGELLNEADQAMYRSKRAGGNRYLFFASDENRS
jgi:diguanylate cyclase (GGDEF)-like protein